MCGIMAYLGKKPALPIIIKGLYALENRGYDSAGVAWIEGKKVITVKAKGKVKELDNKLSKFWGNGLAIGHTRWATHGPPSELNAHPHLDCKGEIAIVHNGTVENYPELREYCLKKGHRLVSETDTELIAHLIESFNKGDLLKATRQALELIKGTYALALVSSLDPERLILASNVKALRLGISKDAIFAASEILPLVEHTRDIVYLKDHQIADVRPGSYKIYDFRHKLITPEVVKVKENVAFLEKGGFKHYMIKEIYDQPRVLRDAMRGRLDAPRKKIRLGAIEDQIGKIIKKKRIIFTACGTSLHACLVAEYLFENFLGIPVEVEYASEFCYRQAPLDKNCLVIAVSQSGETADTLQAVLKAKEQGVMTLGVCNVVGSTIARAVDSGIYLHVGPEIGVASTKAFTGQLTILTLLALRIAKALKKKIEPAIYAEIESIPKKIEQVLRQEKEIERIARKFKNAAHFLYLGRGYNFPLALEGALKLKEVSYIHAEGDSAAEMKHGPIALIDNNMPVVFIAPQDELHEKIVSNMKEVQARGGKIIALINPGDKVVSDIAEEKIIIPKTLSFLSPLIAVVPLQLLAYHIANMKHLDVDKPRNLAKSVTVE